MNHSTPKSSNTGELHELRYRISQLEHLIVTNSLNVTNSSSLPSNSTLLYTPHGLIDRINELEGLLAASEHENEHLRKQIELLHVEKNRQEVQLLEKVFRLDTDKKDLQHEKGLLEVQLNKAHQKLGNIQDYINELPCQEELDEVRSSSMKWQEQTQLLEGQLHRMKENVTTLQTERMSLEIAMRQAELKLDELKPLEEAQHAFSKDGELAPLDLTDTHKVTEFLTLQKAQLLRSSKVISSLKEKLSQLHTDKADGLIKITNLECDLSTLHTKLIASQLKIETLVETEKNLNQEKMELISKNTDLNNQIQRRECSLEQRDNHIHSLIELVAEVDLSVKDVEKLVELGRSLALGEEPSVSTLLGLGEDFDTNLSNLLCKEESSTGNVLDISNMCSQYSPNDPEWTLNRLVKIRSVRKHVRELRDVASDLYTDMLGGKVEGCAMQ